MIRVKDPKVSLKFYQEVLGMEVISGAFIKTAKLVEQSGLTSDRN